MEEKKRRIRSDKKKAINPIVPQKMYDHLCRLAYVCDRPLKDIGERLIFLGLNNRSAVETLQPFFRRMYWFSDYVSIEGDPKRKPVYWHIGPDPKRINLRFPKDQYDKLNELAYSLDTSLLKVTAIFIETSMQSQQCMADLLAYYVQDDLDHLKMRHLTRVLGEINKKGEEETDISIGILSAYLLQQMGDRAKKMTDMIAEWLADLKKKKAEEKEGET